MIYRVWTKNRKLVCRVSRRHEANAIATHLAASDHTAFYSWQDRKGAKHEKWVMDSPLAEPDASQAA